jgi:hypothetical protein
MLPIKSGKNENGTMSFKGGDVEQEKSREEKKMSAGFQLWRHRIIVIDPGQNTSN